MVAASALLCAAWAAFPPFAAEAQRATSRVTQVSTSAGANGTTVSIAADGSLGRAQTWHDSEGYHVVVPDTVAADSIKTSKGVKIRRVGGSLEIIVQTKPGAKVNVQSSDNKLHLAIDGKLDPGTPDFESTSPSPSSNDSGRFRDPQQLTLPRQDNQPLKFSSASEGLTSPSRAPVAETAHNSTNFNPQMGPQTEAPSQPSKVAPPIAQVVPASDIQIQPEDDGLVASVFSGSSVFVVMVLGLFGLLVSRKLRSRQAILNAAESKSKTDGEDDQVFETTIRNESSPESASTGLVRSGQSASAGVAKRQSSTRLQVAGPTSLFGAYRIDQEVGKLVYGQAHRLDVLSSRAIDDRRAIEASLIKSVNSLDLDENGRRKAREALEEYGFVARQCAALLLATDAFERTSAARSLGEIKSPAALPFLLESLYDSESIVRNQAVVSIGELKLPSAIGALLDIARIHPDIPSALLSRTLSACSVEGLDFFDAVMPEPALLGAAHSLVVEQITHLEPTTSVEDLPETLDDEQLARALSLVTSSDVQERAEGLKALVQFRVHSAVEAMALVASNDSEPNLRSAAISSLGTINHESVFPAILIGMADEAREVRAAAARSLNRLSFDRSEAYVRVIEICDAATISNVAKACIQAGIVSQNLDRLATSDHRQAYETFSLICLLAKAQMNQPVLDAIADHPNGDVRIKAVHLLACTGQPEVFQQLRELAVRDGVREDVRTALLEAMYKLDQAQPTEEKIDEAVLPENEPQNEVAASETPADFQPDLDPEVVSDFEFEGTPEVEHNQFEFKPTIEAEAQPTPDDVEV